MIEPKLLSAEELQHFRLDTGRGIPLPRDILSLLAHIAALNQQVSEARALGWRDALSAIQYCEANWLQDCRSDEERGALTRAVKELVDELVSAEPTDWLKTEWKNAQGWMEQIAARDAEIERLNKLPSISLDGPHLPNNERTWLARKLLDSKLSDEEAFSIVAFHPDIQDALAPQPKDQKHE